MTTKNDQLLRRALLGNAAFSTLSGIAFVSASALIADYLGISPSWLVTTTGIGLIGFAAWLVWLARREAVPSLDVRIVIGADLAWVVLSAACLAMGVLRADSALGVLLVADVVLLFAALQFWGLRRAQRAPLHS